MSSAIAKMMLRSYMKIKRLTIENFKSFQYPVTIDFPEISKDKNIFLIGGMNGAGKTTLMEAINLCLYGAKQEYVFKNINRKEFDRKNTNVCINLLFESDNHDIIEIKRSWKSIVVSNPRAKDLEESLIVIKNNEIVSVKSKELWQDFINSNFPESITQFFFFDGEKIQEIAADDHSEIRLKSSLEAALGIQYISKLSKDLLHLKDEERKGYIDISDEDIDFKESELKKERAKLENLIVEKNDIQNELNNFKKENEECKKRFKLHFNIDIKEKNSKKEVEKNRLNLTSKLIEKDNTIKNLIAKHLPWGLAINIFNDIKEQIEFERNGDFSKMMFENFDLLLIDIEKALNEPTPLMNAKLDDLTKNELALRLQKIMTQSKNQSDSFLNLSEREIAKTLNLMEEIEDSNLSILHILLQEKEELEEKILKIENDFLFSLTENEEEIFKDLMEQSESYQTQIGRQGGLLKNVCDDIIKTELNISKIETELSKLYDKHSISNDKKEFIKECENISNLLKEYTIKLRCNKIHHLQEKTFKMYKQLSSKSGLIKELIINTDTYEILLYDRDGIIMKKSGLSAGEKEVFAISLLWGLSQTSQISLPIIIDTPLSRLDSIHRDNIVKHYFPNAADQIIILSTDTEVDDSYFKQLENNLCGAGKLVFCSEGEFTTYNSGYFWKQEE